MPHHIRDREGHTTLEDFRFSTFDSGRLTFVSGVFDDFENAEQAVATLERRGFGKDQISVLMSDEMRRRYLGEESERIEIEKGTKAVEGLGTGGAIGGVLGAIVGAVAAAGTTLLVPGLGLVVAGPLAAALAGAGAGGATGGLLGTLVGAGMPEYRAKYYEERLKKGGIVVGVEARSENEADAVEDELKNHGGEDVKQS